MLDGVEIDIDFWPQIPTYLEFEAGNEEAIKSVVAKLGIDYTNLTTLDVNSIYLHYVINPEEMNTLVLEEERKNTFQL